MKKIMTCLLSISSIILLAGCSIKIPLIPNSNNNTKVNEVPESKTITKKTNPSDNIETDASTSANGKLIVFITNKNSEAVSLEIEVEFYDENNQLVKSGKDSLNGVRPNSEAALEIYETPENYSTYKIYADAEIDDFYITYDKELEVSDNNTGEEIAVQVKNNSENKIDWLSISVVFYKEGKTVGISEGLESDIKAGRSANFNISYAYDKNYDDVEFDDYKVFINEAYTYTD